MNRKLILPLFILLCAYAAAAQVAETKKTEELSEEMRKQAVEFLRETASDVNNLRSLENRISFAAEVASLMWFTDEREARTMFQSVINDFKQLIFEYDSQINQMGDMKEDYSGGGMFGGEPNEKAKLMRKLSKAMAVRQQIMSSVAEHDPRLAFDFYEATLQTISNPDMRQRFASDAYFLTRLLTQIAENDAAQAAELGRKNLANGVNYQHLELLKKIYAKDADKGAEFGEEIVKKVKDTKADSEDFYLLGSVVSLGAENLNKAKKDGKKPMFSEQSLRELTDALAQNLLKSEEPRGMEYITLIERFAPSRAVQLRAKFNSRTATAANRNAYGISGTRAGRGDVPPPPIPPVVRTGEGNAVSEPSAEENLAKDFLSLQNKELPKEEREKVIGKARKIIAALPSRQAKLFALSGLAAQVAKLGDKELADEVMREAEGLVNLQPKNFQQYIEVWMLINGYSQSNPQKAFPILEDTVFRVNDTLNAFVKVAEFIDVQGEIIEDDEIQVGAFGGSMVREITRGLGQTDSVLQNLAKADFARTKSLPNRFDKPEIRVLAKMLILRAVFGDAKKGEATEEGAPFGINY